MYRFRTWVQGLGDTDARIFCGIGIGTTLVLLLSIFIFPNKFEEINIRDTADI